VSINGKFFFNVIGPGRRIIVLAVLFFCLDAYSSKDSLIRVINSLPDDTNKVNALFDLSMSVQKEDSVASVTYAHYTLVLAEKLKFVKGQALAYYAMGRLSHEYNEHDKAITLFSRGVALSQKANYATGIMRCYYWMARCYRRTADYSNYGKFLALLEQQAAQQKDKTYLSYAYEGYGNLYRYIGDYPESIENYLKAIDLSEELGNLEDVSLALNNMSLVYEYQGKLREGLKAQERGYSVLQRLGEKSKMVLCLSNLSVSYHGLGQNEKAKEYIGKAMAIIKELGPGKIQFKDVASAYGQFASMAADRGDYAIALEYFNEDFKLREANKDKKGLSDACGSLAYVYGLLGKDALATEYLMKQLAMAGNIGYTNGQIKAYRSLADLEIKQADYKAAYYYMQQYTLLKDSILNQASVKRMAEVEARLKVKEQQQQIKLLSRNKAMQTLELERRNVILYALLIGIFFIVLLALVLLWGYRQKNRINKKLAVQRNGDLKDFIYRSSHDIRSPLATIKGFINLAQSDVSDPEAVLNYLSKISGVVEKQDLMLGGLMQVSGTIEGKPKPEKIELGKLVSEVLENIKRAEYAKGIYTEEIIQQGLQIETDKLMLTTVIENLVSNAMKYRRRQQEDSFVRLEAFKHKKGVLIKVSDNGQGIADDWKEKIFKLFTRASTEVNGFGLGLYIVRNSVEMLGGKISVSSELRKGSVFSVWLPLKMA
jgi:signal transduction histidine kinase